MLRGRFGTLVAVIGASTGRFGAVWPQAEVREVVVMGGRDASDLVEIAEDKDANNGDLLTDDRGPSTRG